MLRSLAPFPRSTEGRSLARVRRARADQAGCKNGASIASAAAAIVLRACTAGNEL